MVGLATGLASWARAERPATEPTPTAATAAAAPLWAANENHVYRVAVTLPAAVANGAQGQTAATTFTWEAQS